MMITGEIFKDVVARLRLRRYKAETPESTYPEVDAKTTSSFVDGEELPECPGTPQPSGLTWHEKFWRQCPILGISALLLAIGCVFAALVVLIVSDGQPTAAWESAPVSMYLSVFVTVCNLLIRFGLANALPILWWRHAMEGRTIADLNREWEVGRNLLQAFGSLRSVGLVLLATFSSAILILAGPLLQKASNPVLAVPSGPVTFSVQMAPQLPSDWSGYMFSNVAFYPSKNFSQIYAHHLRKDIINTTIKDCRGLCRGTILAPGLVHRNCKRISFVADYENKPDSPLQNRNASRHGALRHYLLFKSEYNLPPSHGKPDYWLNRNRSHFEPLSPMLPDSDRGLMVLDTAWANLTDRVGHLWYTRCLVAAATLECEIVANENGSITPISFHKRPLHALANNTLRYWASNSSTPSSFSAAMQQATGLLSSSYYFTDESDGEVSTAGLLGAMSILNDDAPNFSSIDPLEQVIAIVNELLFRGGAQGASLANASPESLGLDKNCLYQNGTCSLWQTINGTRTDEVSVYHTNMTFWGLAAFTQFLAIALIVPIFWGWWRLGREVSFSPFEIAEAFDAPLLQAAHSNSKAEGIVSTVGFIPVRYGVVHHSGSSTTANQGKDSYDQEQEAHEVHGAGTESMAASRLAFTDGLEVKSPHHQQRFAE